MDSPALHLHLCLWRHCRWAFAVCGCDYCTDKIVTGCTELLVCRYFNSVNAAAWLIETPHSFSILWMWWKRVNSLILPSRVPTWYKCSRTSSHRRGRFINLRMMLTTRQFQSKALVQGHFAASHARGPEASSQMYVAFSPHSITYVSWYLGSCCKRILGCFLHQQRTAQKHTGDCHPYRLLCRCYWIRCSHSFWAR